MSYYGFYNQGTYSGYQPSQNWTQGPPPSAPPSSGTAIQFGTFLPGQMEQHGYPPAQMYHAPYGTPYAMPMMAQPYAAYHAQMQHQPAPPGAPPPTRDVRSQRKHDARPRPGPPPQHRDRDHPQRDTPPHPKGPQMVDEHRRDASTPTQGHREGPPSSYSAQQSGTPPMTAPMMHPHPHYAPMPYYHYPPPYHPSHYPMQPMDPQMEPQQGGYQGKGPTNRLQLELNLVQRPNAPTSTPASNQNQDANDLVSPKNTAPSNAPKKRLQFVNPDTQTPIENLPDQMSASTPLGNAGAHGMISNPSSRPSSPGINTQSQTEVSKLVNEVMSVPRDRSTTTTSKFVSKVGMTGLRTPESTIKKPTMNRTPVVQINSGKKIIDPSNGAYQPGSLKSDPQQKPQNLDSTSLGAKVLNTVESIERRVEEDSSKEAADSKKQEQEIPIQESSETGLQQPSPSPEFTLIRNTGTNKRTESASLILPTNPTTTATVDRGSGNEAKVIIGSRMVAPAQQNKEKEKPQKQDPLPVEKVEDLPLVKTERPVSPASEPQQTPSKTQQTIKDKIPDPEPPARQSSVDSATLLPTVDLESPMKQSQQPQQQPPRRTSSGKLLSRSSSYQTISRKNSTNSIRPTRSAKIDNLEVFHTSSGKRKYTSKFLKSCKDKFQDKPSIQDSSLSCMSDFEGTGLKSSRSGSDRWSKPSTGRAGYESMASLGRNLSGRDRQKDTTRPGAVVIRGRLSRQFSGNRGEEGGKWGKSDLNLVSPFAPGAASGGGGQGLHKTENKYIVGAYQTDDPDEEKRQKTFKGLLNKLTPNNFEKMFEKFKEVDIPDPITLRGLIDQIFDKALIETTFCPLYSDLCKLLTTEMPEFEDEGDHRKITFRRLLLNKCQAEYEKGHAAARAEKEAKDESTTITEEDRVEKLAQARKERLRTLGNMQFIGFLFKKGMLTERIIHNCIVDLLKEDENPKSEDIECLCKLVCTVGELLPKDKNLDAYFSRIDRLSKNKKLETRHRFMLIDLIELKGRGWIERREKEGPKTIEEIHRDALAEQQAQNARNRGSYGSDRRETSSFSSRGRGAAWSRSTTTRSTPQFTNTHEEVRPLTKNLSLGRTDSLDISLRPSTMDSRSGSRPAVVSMPRPKSPAADHASRATPMSISEQEEHSTVAPLQGEELDRKVKALLTEYYDIKDLEEALRCIEELSEKNASKSDILRSILLTGLDIRGIEVELRLQPIIPVISELLRRKIFTPQEAKQGLKSTMAALPEIAEDFPKAPVLIAKMLGTLASTGVVPLKPLLDPNTGIILGAGRDEKSEEDPPLIDGGYGSIILIEMLKQMKSEEEESGKTVREQLSIEETDLSLFYPFYHRGEIDLSEELQFLDI